jgi:hypothetical protein
MNFFRTTFTLCLAVGLGLTDLWAQASKTKEKPTASAKPTGAAGSGAVADPKRKADRDAALMRAINAGEKSEAAGEVFKRFLENKTAAEKLKLIVDPGKNSADVEKYCTTSPNREYKPLGVQILGTVAIPSRPGKMLFPYFVATDKNKSGFIVTVLETDQGFRVDWNTFAKGQDNSLGKFLKEKKSGSTISILLGISKGHIFSDAPAGGEAKWDAYNIDMPQAPEELDQPKFFVEKNSPTGQTLAKNLGWLKGHLCQVTLSFEGGDTPYLIGKSYEPYVK